MIFRKVTTTKYIGSDGYTLIRGSNNLYNVCINNRPTEWGTNFSTVKSAELFVNNHDYIHATTDLLPISADDIEFAMNLYGLDAIADDVIGRDGIRIEIIDEKLDGTEVNDPIYLLIKDSNHEIIVKTADELFEYLDTKFSEEDIFASIILRGIGYRQILAKSTRRSARDITKDLVRVKSSNVWAYGIEIKDAKDKVSDVYIQFKDKNGGPGDIYRYFDIPVSLWRKFLGAPSKGHFFWKYIRNNFYYSKLTGDRRGKLKNAVN